MSNSREILIGSARELIGKIPYKRYPMPCIQDFEKGLNCYGFVRHVAKQNGIDIPYLGCREMWENLQWTNSPKTGDLVFTKGKYLYPGHVGILDREKNTVIHLSKRIGTVNEENIMDFFDDIMGYRSIEKYLENGL